MSYIGEIAEHFESGGERNEAFSDFAEDLVTRSERAAEGRLLRCEMRAREALLRRALDRAASALERLPAARPAPDPQDLPKPPSDFLVTSGPEAERRPEPFAWHRFTGFALHVGTMKELLRGDPPPPPFARKPSKGWIVPPPSEQDAGLLQGPVLDGFARPEDDPELAKKLLAQMRRTLAELPDDLAVAFRLYKRHRSLAGVAHGLEIPLALAAAAVDEAVEAVIAALEIARDEEGVA